METLVELTWNDPEAFSGLASVQYSILAQRTDILQRSRKKTRGKRYQAVAGSRQDTLKTLRLSLHMYSLYSTNYCIQCTSTIELRLFQGSAA